MPRIVAAALLLVFYLGTASLAQVPAWRTEQRSYAIDVAYLMPRPRGVSRSCPWRKYSES